MVLRDLLLPDSSWLEVLVWLRADPLRAGGAVIVLSASAVPAEFRAARAGGLVA